MYYKVITYGCQMNVHESEKIAGILSSMGYEATEDAETADVVVFNTCCIRDTAERRALGNIGALKPLKRQRKDMIIAVCGCMTEQSGYIDVFKKKYPFVDIVLGTKNISLLGGKIEALLRTRKRQYDADDVENYLDADEQSPVLRTSYPNAWINIMYGCNNFCSYCIVPYVRGREISRDSGLVLDEVRKAVDGGYREITLLGQNVNSYNGGEGKDFAYILREIDKLPGKFRVRFMTSHPKDLTESIVDAIASSDKICNNIHLPVQSGSTDVLAKMNRRYTREHYLELIDMIRAKLGNGVGITTDIMVGFPTETDKDFEDTLDLVERCRFSNAFTFIYSVRKGTKAAAMEQLPYVVKKERIGRLIALQNKITKEISEEYVGKAMEILVEDVYPKLEGTVCGRTDCGRLVTFSGNADMIGSFETVRVTESRSASLHGELVKE